MKREIFKFGIKVAVMVISLLLFYNGYSAWLTKQIHELYKDRQITVNHDSKSPEKVKGNILIRESSAASNMVVFGSSELNSFVPENPKNLFPNDKYTGDADFIGGAYFQNIIHTINIGANEQNFKDKDIVIVESLQWYMGEDQSVDGFMANMSELQFYEFISNPRISKENKEYLCNRYYGLDGLHEVDAYPLIETAAKSNKFIRCINKYVLQPLNKRGYELIQGEPTYLQTYVYSRVYPAKSITNAFLRYTLEPYYALRKYYLHLKDKYKAYMWLKTLEIEEKPDTLNINWKEMEKIAEKEGEEQCTNNDFYCRDDYYIKYLEKNIDNIKNKDAETQLLVSNEWDDFCFFLNVCKELNFKPYVISMSTNGWYYDYCGIDINKRKQLYDKIEDMVITNGMECLTTTDKEYEPYFYYDVMHLGWKGWPYVLQQIIEHFS